MNGVAQVERQIAKAGRIVTLRRAVNDEPLDIEVKAFVRGYAPAELVGDIGQGDREVKISNREMRETNWPGPPVKGDRIVIAGVLTTVEAVDPGYLGEDLALFTLRVRG